MVATLNDGDEVILPSPYWTTYADIEGNEFDLIAN